MMNRFIIFAGVLAFASPVGAQQMQCADRATVVQLLTGQFSEVPASAGLAPAGLVELWVSPIGTWTLTLTTPRGATCLVASGTEWGPMAAVARKPNL